MRELICVKVGTTRKKIHALFVCGSCSCEKSEGRFYHYNVVGFVMNETRPIVIREIVLLYVLFNFLLSFYSNQTTFFSTLFIIHFS